jgi:hypothetical protein
VIVVVKENAGALIDLKASKSAIHRENVLRSKKAKNECINEKNNSGNEYVSRQLRRLGNPAVGRAVILNFEIVCDHW